MPDFESLYRQFFPKVYNYIYYRLLNRDQTDDLVSEIFTRIFEKLDTYDESKAQLSTWVFAVTKHALINERRRMKPTVSLDALHNDNGVELPLDYDLQLSYIQSEERRQLYKALARMSAREREIISMKYFEGMNNRTIASELDMNESTVSSVVFAAKKKLQKWLMAEEGEVNGA